MKSKSSRQAGSGARRGPKGRPSAPDLFVFACAVDHKLLAAHPLPAPLAHMPRPRLWSCWRRSARDDQAVSWDLRIDCQLGDRYVLYKLLDSEQRSLRASLSEAPGLVVGLLHQDDAPILIATLHGGGGGEADDGGAPITGPGDVATCITDSLTRPCLGPEDLEDGGLDAIAQWRGPGQKLVAFGPASLSIRSTDLLADLPPISGIGKAGLLSA